MLPFPISSISPNRISRRLAGIAFPLLMFATVGGNPCDAQENTCVESWLSMREQWRTVLSPLRQPKYDWLLLARAKTVDGQCVCEKFEYDSLPGRVVLVVGGLQSNSEASKHFAQSLERQVGAQDEMRFGVFDYPNDGSLEESGDVLRELLTRISRESPRTRVTIVSHSMGGLIARRAIEKSESSSNERAVQCVDQLIMICPPNHGSVLAQYADALELADVYTKFKETKQSPIAAVISLLDDGLGEACDDLVPNSKFLRRLNGEERAKGVRYCVFAGTAGPIDPWTRLAGTVLLKETKQLADMKNLDRPVLNETRARAKELIECDELAHGLGDGAVSVRSASLDGVHDFVKVPIHHTEWCKTDGPKVQDLIRRVASKIARP
ncbi:MAG: alpha/beta hydrolase [Pirellula sp.]